MSIPFTPVPINHFHFAGPDDISLTLQVGFSEDPQDTLPRTNNIARWKETRAPKRKWSNFQPSVSFGSPQGANGDWTCAEGFAGEAPHLTKRDRWIYD